VGDYHFFCTYQKPDGDWNTCIDLGFGLTDEDRTEDINVKALKESEVVSGKEVYTLYVGAFSTEQVALNWAKEISDKGYQTYVIKDIIKNLYTIRIGEYKSREKARNVGLKLYNESGYKYTFFIIHSL